MRTPIRFALTPVLLLALASCGGEGEPIFHAASTVNSTSVHVGPGSGAYALVVGIQNFGTGTFEAPLCGDTPLHYASAVRDQLVDGVWTPPPVAPTCGLADATVVVDVTPYESKPLLRMVVPGEAGTYRFRWTVPTSDGGAAELVTPPITVTVDP